VIGNLVRARAQKEYESTAAQRKVEVEAKMAARAQSRFEEEAAPLVQALDANIEKYLRGPLGQLELHPEITVERPAEGQLNARIRIAGEHQLAGHTPRPRALAGSMASLQVHESALNNMLQQLRLDGRTMTATALGAEINRKFGTSVRYDEEKSGRLTISFAEKDAVRVRLAGGRLTYMIHLARLRGGTQSWSNFEIHVPYVAEPYKSTVQLRQVSEPELIGRLSNRSKLLIQGILTNFFDIDNPIELRPTFLRDEQLRGLERGYADTHVKQIVIEDGWMGFSMTRR
jgi:hypothetical protein